MPDDKFEPIHRHFEPTRGRDEDHSIHRQCADKFANRSSAVKAAPRLSGPAGAEPTAPSLTVVRGPRLGLSLTQILGSAGAAVTAAFLGSRLGVAGTLIGAALASVISVVGGAIYTSSIKATRHRVSRAMVSVRGPDGTDGAPATAPLPAVGSATATHPPERPTMSRRLVGAQPRRRNGPTGGRPGRPGLRVAAVASLVSAAVFAGALALVTGYETVSGTALSGGRAGSLTILGGQSAVERYRGPSVPEKAENERATTSPTGAATSPGAPSRPATSSRSTDSGTTSGPKTSSPTRPGGGSADGSTPGGGSTTRTSPTSSPARLTPAAPIPDASSRTPSSPAPSGTSADSGTTIPPTGTGSGAPATSSSPTTTRSPTSVAQGGEPRGR